MRITKLREDVLGLFNGSDRQSYEAFRKIVESHPHKFISIERNREIVTAYFTPQDDGNDATLRSLAATHNISYERVRQIIAKSVAIIKEQMDYEATQSICEKPDRSAVPK